MYFLLEVALPWSSIRLRSLSFLFLLTNLLYMQRFLGMVNFYRKFLLGAARVLAPLTDALKGSSKSLTWTPLLNTAFRHAKNLLIKVPELAHP